MHPSHENQLVRLKKVEGQVRGIQTMIKERRYCMDLLSQIRAVTGAMRKIESGILENTWTTASMMRYHLKVQKILLLKSRKLYVSLKK